MAAVGSPNGRAKWTVATKSKTAATMVHSWIRSWRAWVIPDMLQPRERSGRSAATQPHSSPSLNNTHRHSGGSKSGEGSVGGSGGGGVGGVGGNGGGGGLCLLSRLGQYRRRQQEQHRRRVAEKELDTLHQRIDKLLAKMEEGKGDNLQEEDEECVVCLGARATMQTLPCEHRVVCRKCFIRTIQVAVAQRSLPLRCVVCRARILKIRHTTFGLKALSVSTQSPFHSSSAPPATHSPRDTSGELVLNNCVTNNTTSNGGKICSLSKAVVPFGRDTKTGQRQGRPMSSGSRRVTLTKGTPSHFSILSQTGHFAGKESCPLAGLAVPVKAEPAAKFVSSNRKDELISNSSSVTKGHHPSQPSRRGRGFPFKPLFWRQ